MNILDHYGKSNYNYEFYCPDCEASFFPWQVRRNHTLIKRCPVCNGEVEYTDITGQKPSTTIEKKSTTRSHAETH